MNKPLYDRDFYAWTQAQAEALRRRSANELDWENLQEEIDSMGKKEARQLERRLAILIAHILKWRTQPELRSRSWVATIRVQQRDIPRLIEENPSLKAHLDALLEAALDEGRDIAAAEMGRIKTDLEWEGAFSFDDLMAFEADLIP